MTKRKPRAKKVTIRKHPIDLLIPIESATSLATQSESVLPAPVTDTSEEAKKLHSELLNEIHKRQLSNSQEKDKAILTLATAMLGVSLTFIDRLVKISEAEHLWLLEFAWLGFVLSILSTLLSYHASQFGLDRLMVQARRYYIEKDDSAINEPNRGRTSTVWLNGIATITFTIAVFVLVAFIWKNIPRR